MTRKCPRTLDKPLLLMGLEIEDLGVIVLIGGGGGLVFGPVVPGIGVIIGWIVLVRFKRNKPQGYLIHWLYSKGIDFPGLLPPLKKVKIYSIYGSNQK